MKEPKNPQTHGQCRLCSKSITLQGAKRHAAVCFQTGQQVPNSYIIKIQAPATRPTYWLILSVPFTATLENLDSFLRDIWLECCGHMSIFQIGGTLFSSYLEPSPYDSSSELPMTLKIEDTLKMGVKFTHRYDMGSTTTLYLETIGIHHSKAADIQLLIQNDAPSFSCGTCGKSATLVCSVYGVYSCERCYAKLDEAETYFLPIVNSPRTGTCGYTGGGFF